MKSLLRIAIVFTAFTLAIASCGYDDVETDKVESMKVQGFDNSGELPRHIANGRCSGNAYMMWVSFQLADYADVAHLASPMTGLRIITATDFDEQHPAGCDVSGLFMLHPIRPEISMTEYETNTYQAVRFAVPTEQSPLATVYREGAYFMLTMAPAGERQCRFTVEVQFADGTVLSAAGDEVTLY